LNNTRKYTKQELIEGIARSDSNIIKQIYSENFRTIRHMVVSNSGNEYDAKDVFQEVLVILYRKTRDKNFELTCSLNTFLYSIARIFWLNELKNRKRSCEFIDMEDQFVNLDQSVTEIIERNDRLRLYREKFEELSEDCKKILRMFLNNIPIKEITKIMRYSSDQHTKNRRFRCKKSLIDRIRNNSKFNELGHEENKNN
jgi:RNA polymerase sigma factor (sigma-70 family)